MIPGKLLSAVMPYAGIAKWVLILGAPALLGWEGHNLVVYKPHLAHDAQVAERMQERVNQINAASATISSNWAQQLALSKDNLNAATRTVIQAVPVYLPAPARAPGEVSPVAAPDADLPNGAVQLLDYAASGVPIPAPSPGRDLAGRSGIDLPQAVSTIAGNYGQCLQWRAEVVSWRGWYRDLAVSWPKESKK